jgi:hypothetical protein
MKTITLNILKKNRVYFACTNDQNYPCKLKITETSKNLEIGKHELLVNDISVRSKYGIDVIYELESVVDSNSICTLRHARFNTEFVSECKNLGGKWDADERAWIFSSIVSDRVDELEFLYNSESVNIEIKALDCIYRGQDSVYFLGYSLAKATGRDSGATLGNDISLMSGEIKSAGSAKNWVTEISEGTTFRLSISRELLEKSIKENHADTKLFEIKCL